MSRYRKRSELARFLGKPPEEIDRMMEEDGLPHLRMPGKHKPSVRFRLRDVWRWVQKWNQGCDLKSFEDFEREFEEAQGRSSVIGQ